MLSSRKLLLRYKRAARHGADEVADERTRDFGGEQHRHLAGRQRARVEARCSAFGGASTHRRGLLQVLGGQCGAVPAIALHVFAVAGDQCAAEGVLGAALATGEPMRVGVHAQARAAADGSAIGVRDPRVAFATGVLASQREVDGAVSIDAPWVPGVEFRPRAIRRQLRHQLALGKSGGRIVFGMARDRAGLFDGGVEAVLVQVGGAGAALALAEIHGDGNAAVAGRLDRLDLAHAHVDVEAVLLGARDLGLAGAARAAALQQLLCGRGQLLQAGCGCRRECCPRSRTR